MPVLGIDLGGTKLATSLFSESGALISKDVFALGNRSGKDVPFGFEKFHPYLEASVSER